MGTHDTLDRPTVADDGDLTAGEAAAYLVCGKENFLEQP